MGLPINNYEYFNHKVGCIKIFKDFFEFAFDSSFNVEIKEDIEMYFNASPDVKVVI